MRCHVCNVAVGDGQRFCHECGESLSGVTDPTEAHDTILASDSTSDTDDSNTSDDADAGTGADPDSDPDADADADADADSDSGEDATVPDVDERAADELAWADDPANAPTEAVAVTTAHRSTSSLDAVPDQVEEVDAPLPDPASLPDPVPVYEPTLTMPVVAPPTPVTDEIPVAGVGHASTTVMSATAPGPLFDGASDVHEYAPAPERFRLRATLVFAVLVGVATLMASVADVVDIRTTRPVDGIVVGIRTLDDFGSNLSVAGFVGAGAMLLGAFLSCFGLRWGAGIAGGAGLALAGWAAITLGLVEVPVHTAEGVTVNATDVTPFTLAVTRDLGYFLVLAVGAVGILVFIVSLRMAGTGGSRALNPWIAAVGALASVVLAAGPLITLAGEPLDANLGVVGLPREFFVGRLVQLGLIVTIGVVGFLSVRRYGLGLVAGGLSVPTWMWATSLARIGESPVGIADRNIGAADTMPHAVTTVGMTASLALLLIAATLAAVTYRRT